jgi:hypothetical protein
MMREKSGTILAWVAAIMYLLTAAMHMLGFEPTRALAQQGPADLRPLVPLLWLSFALSLVVLAAIVAACAHRGASADRLILALTALGPLSGALVQIVYIGFVLPSAILLFDAALALTAAALLPGRSPG